MIGSLRIGMLVSTPLPPCEGIGTYAVSLAAELQRRGHEPILITRGRVGPTRTYELDGLRVVELPFVPSYPAHVHLHGVFVSRYLRGYPGGFDLIHAHSPLVPPVRGPWPLLTTLHSRLGEDAQATRVDDLVSLLIRLQTPVSVGLEREILRRSQAVAVVNALIADDVQRDLGGQVPVVVRPNAVDVAQFRPSRRPKVGNEVLAVGRLAHGKGFEDLLTAWPNVLAGEPTARLTIVGDGPLAPRLRERIDGLGLAGRVRLLGAIPADRRESLVRLYQDARVVVQPSHHEGLSTVLLEAMACGAPVVATAVGAHPAVIDDGRNGRLVSARAPGVLAATIAGLLADPDGTIALGRQARATVAETYSWPIVADAYLELYDELVRGARRAH